MTGQPGRSGGAQPGAGRIPAGGKIRALIREAASTLSGNGNYLYDLARRDSLDELRLDECAAAAARDGMRAARRLRKAARLAQDQAR